MDCAEPQEKRRKIDEDRHEFINLAALNNLLSTDEKCLKFCQSYGLLPKSALCPSCKCVLDKVYCRNTRFTFQCNKGTCRKTKKYFVNLKANTWFEGGKISIRKSLLLVYCFVRKFDYDQTIIETSSGDAVTSHGTVSDYFSFCREVCAESLLSDRKVNKIGGTNCVVEIDAAKFGKKKCTRGQVHEEQWVLGGICRDTNACFLVPLTDKSEETILTLICENVKQGTVIHTDCFKSYDKLSQFGFTTIIENYDRENTTYSETGTYTSKIGSTWSAVRRSLPIGIVQHTHFAQHLAEFLWRRGKDKFTLFNTFIRDIAKVYPGPDA